MKEQRSISFAQTERDIQFQQYHKALKPPTTKGKDSQVSNKTNLNDSQSTLQNQSKQVVRKTQMSNGNLDSFKSCDSQIQEAHYALHLPTQEQLTEEYDMLLSSQRSVRTLKSLQNERFNRKASKKRSECREDDMLQNNNNSNKGIPQHQVNQNNSEDYSIKLLNKRKYIIGNQENQNQSLERMMGENLQQNGVHQLRSSVAAAVDQTVQDDSNHFNSRRQSKSSGHLLGEGLKEVGQQMIKQWHQFKKTSMLKGERDSLDGCFSEQSFLEIPNEHQNKNTLGGDSDDKQKKNSSEKKGTQRVRQGGQSQNPNRKRESYQDGSIKHFNINTVRDSSPLKTIGLFGVAGNEGSMFKSGSLSERQARITVTVNNKMFTQQPQKVEVKQTATIQTTDSSYKQPKQGQKKNQPNIPSQKVTQQSLYQTLNSPPITMRDSLLKASNNRQSIYMTQSIGAMNQKLPQNIESDFIHSEEEDDDRFGTKTQTQTLGCTIGDNGSFNAGQSFHLPITQALSQTRSSQQGLRINPKINNLNIRAGPGNISSNNTQKPQHDEQPKSGNLNDHTQQLTRRRIHITLEVNHTNQGAATQRVGSNFRNESLERILGDKANSYFDQIEKIQQKDYLKLNRSLLHNQLTERHDSVNRQASQTPILIQNQDSSTVQPPRSTQIQRKRQLTFTTTGNAKDIAQQKANSIVPKPNNSCNLKNAIRKEIQQQQPQMLTEPPEEDVVFSNEKKPKELPSSPSHFPSSVKDKIKNITQRIKQEIQKQEDHHQNLAKRKSNMSNTGVDQTTSSIKSIFYKEHFKKYLNVDKKESIKKKELARTGVQDRKKRVSNVENQLETLQAQNENYLQDQGICKTTRQPIKKQQDPSPVRKENANNVKQSMFQRRKQSQTTINSKASKGKKGKVLLQNSTKDETFKRKSEFECIIYVPNHPKPEVFQTVDMNQQQPQLQNIVDEKKVPQQQEVKDRKKNEQMISMIGTPNDSLTPDTPFVRKSSEDLQISITPNTNNDNHDEVRETFIKAKLSNLLKETRSKIQEIEYISPRDQEGRLSHVKRQQQENVKSSPKQKVSDSNYNSSSNFNSLRKSELHNKISSNIQTPRSGLKKDNQQRGVNSDPRLSQCQRNLNIQQHSLPQQNDLIRGQVRNSQELNQAQLQQPQLMQHPFLSQPLIDPQFNRYLSQINDAQPLYPQHHHHQPFQSMISTPQYQNLMFQYRQAAPAQPSQECQVHCRCHHSTTQFSQSLLGNQYQMQQPQQHQQFYPHMVGSTPHYQNIQQQIATSDFFNNYVSQQPQQHQPYLLPQYLPPQPYIPIAQPLTQSPFMMQMSPFAQTQGFNGTVQFGQQQQQQTIQFPSHLYDSNTQLGRNQPHSDLPSTKSMGGGQSQMASLGAQLENALLEMEKMDD